MLESVKRQGEFMKPQMEGKTDANPEPVKSHQNRNLIAPDVGRKLVFDNIDYRHEVHYMTEEHQNVDNHCVTLMAVENRVSGNHLNNQQPEGGVMKLENGKYIPSSIWQYDEVYGKFVLDHLYLFNFVFLQKKLQIAK